MLELLTGVLCFLNIVDTFLKVKDKISSQVDRADAGLLLERIADLLLEVQDDLARGIYPHDKCSEMWSYLKNLERLFIGKLPDADVADLQAQITEAYRVEQLLGQLNCLNDESKQKNLNLLKEVAGAFRAAAVLIKFGK